VNETKLPTIGAAMPVADLPQYVDWLKSGQRDLEIQDPILFETLDSGWQRAASETKSLLDGHTGRVGIHGPFISLTLAASDPKIRTVVTDRLCQGVEFAHAIGGTHMVMHSPFDFFGHPHVAQSPAMGLERTIAEIHKTVDPVLELAKQAEVTLVIETIYDTHVRPLLTLIDSFASDHVRLSIDTGHAFITHRIGGPSPDQWAYEGGARLGHVHIQDTDGLWDRHWSPGRGNINWYAFFEALRKLEHSPRLILELRERNEILCAAQWLAEQGFAR
jgi:sugar phosphate isomerase/epimerase